MFKKIALATITAAALVAPPSLVHAGVKLQNGVSLNGVEPAGREVYFVGERAGGETSTVLTIELPQGQVALRRERQGRRSAARPSHGRLTSGAS